MKRLILAGILFGLLLAMMPLSSAAPTRTTMEAVEGTLDFDYTLTNDSLNWYNYTIYLPCEFYYIETDPMFSITNNDTLLNYTITVNDEDIW